MKSRFVGIILILLAASTLFTAGVVQAQSIFLEPNSGPGINLEALRLGSPYANYSNLSFAYYLSANIPVGDGLQLRTEIPWVYYQRDYLAYNYDYGYSYPYIKEGESVNSFGNPYLGVDVGNLFDGFAGEFGIRVPVMNRTSDVGSSEAMNDPVERLEAFAPDILSIFVGGNYRYRSGNGFAMRLRAVPVVWIPVGDQSSADPEVFVIYSAQAWYEDHKVGVGGGFSGRMIMTGDSEGLGERTLHQFGFFANYQFGNVMPGFQVRFPLDADLKDPFQGLGMSPNYSLSIGIKL